MIAALRGAVYEVLKREGEILTVGLVGCGRMGAWSCFEVRWLYCGLGKR